MEDMGEKPSSHSSPEIIYYFSYLNKSIHTTCGGIRKHRITDFGKEGKIEEDKKRTLANTVRGSVLLLTFSKRPLLG